jgi:hypothetical protein
MRGLQPNFKLAGDFLENCFVWYFSTAHIADGYSTASRSPDDVEPALDAGGKEQAARMSRQTVAHDAHRGRRAQDQ